jgi:membrane dipeptidase
MNPIDDKTQFGSFDYGLSEEQEQKAVKLHAESIVCDMIYWGPCSYLSNTPEMEKELEVHWNTFHDPGKTSILGIFQHQRYALQGKFPEYKKCWDDSGLTAGNRTVDGFTSLEALIYCFGWNQAMFDHFPWLVKALKADDFRRAKAEGKHAAWINTQLLMGVNLDFIRLVEPAYMMGLRMIQLSYNFMTYIASGCTERTDAGVSNYGAKLIQLMNALGIIVDISHCGRQSTLDACQLSDKPVIASHASAEAVYKHARAKSDEELKAIAATGGVIGIVTVPFFLAGGEGVGMESWMDHADYIAKLVGWEHVAIGSDWPMPMPKSILKDAFNTLASEAGFREEDNIDSATNLIGFDDYRDLPNITRGLVSRGYRDEQIKGILGENFLRVFEEVCG